MVAKTLITFTISDRDPVGHSMPKTSPPIPTVYLDIHTLIFMVGHPDYDLYIKDANDNILYSTAVLTSTTSLILPAILDGTYKLELIMDNWLFTGWIDL